MARSSSPLCVPLHPDLGLMAQRGRRVLRKADPAPPQTRRVRLDRGTPSRDKPLLAGNQRCPKTLHLDRRPRQNHRRRATRAPNVRFDPLAAREMPDVVLMDIQLPDVSGIEATRRLKANAKTKSIPIIAVTAFAMSGDQAAILASGCNEYISKPFNVTELLEIVDRYAKQEET